MWWWKKKAEGWVSVGSMYGRCGSGWKLKIKCKIKERENKSIAEEKDGCGVSEILPFVLK